jgi:hypothetical protein
MSKRRLSLDVQRVVIFRRIALLVMMGTISVAHGAYGVLRPSGPVWQAKLWGVKYPAQAVFSHKGIDFVVPDGTPVHAVADGVVAYLFEDYDDSDPADLGFGNYVVVRHTRGGYIRHNNGSLVRQNGFVYSIYAHLKRNSVPVTIGANPNQDRAFSYEGQ